jgi:hypothetical protein
MLEVFAGKVRKTGFCQKAGFPENSDKNFGISHDRRQGLKVQGTFMVRVGALRHGGYYISISYGHGRASA